MQKKSWAPLKHTYEKSMTDKKTGSSDEEPVFLLNDTVSERCLPSKQSPDLFDQGHERGKKR